MSQNTATTPSIETSGLLNAKCKEQLLERAVKALTATKVTNGYFLHGPSTIGLVYADQVLPDHGPVRDRLNAYVSEWPFYDFARDSVARMLRDSSGWSQDKEPKLLSEHAGFEDIPGCAAFIVNQFDTLPWLCELTLPLPDPLGSEFLGALGPTQFGDRIALVALDESHSATYPLQTKSEILNRDLGGGGLLMSGPPQWPMGAAALKVKFDGYINMYSVSEVIQDALGYIDSFFGICVALNLLSTTRAASRDQWKAFAYFHQFSDGAWTAVRRYELDGARSAYISAIDLTQSVKAADSPTRTSNFLWVAARIKDVFRDATKSRQVISASQWLLNSYSAGNGMLAFVQATVALEILLGDEKANDGIGLTELLRNRCAYLIAGDQAEREAIKKQFTEIYAVRSKIVHAGKSRLTGKEWRLLGELQALGHRVIAKEIELLPKPKRPILA